MTESQIKSQVKEAVELVRSQKPLSPSITNTVTINFVANAQIAVGGSAAMVYLPDEGEFVSEVGSSVYINAGTMFPIYEETLPRTAKRLFELKKNWVLDPVGIGIGSLRTKLLSGFKDFPPSIVRGNASEVIALAKLWGITGTSSSNGPKGVDTVDSVKVAEGCESVLTKYAHELCPDIPEEKDEDGNVIVEAVPYGQCATGTMKKSKNELRAAMNNRMEVFCVHDLVNEDDSRTIGNSSAFNTNIMNQIIKDIYDKLGIAFTIGCEEMGGTWVTAGEVARPDYNMLVQEYYTKYYGTSVTSISHYKSLGIEDYGWCISADRQNQCLNLGEEYTMGLDSNGSCKLTDLWFMDMCLDILHGRWDGANCVMENVTQEMAGGKTVRQTTSTCLSDIVDCIKKDCELEGRKPGTSDYWSCITNPEYIRNLCTLQLHRCSNSTGEDYESLIKSAIQQIKDWILTGNKIQENNNNKKTPIWRFFLFIFTI